MRSCVAIISLAFFVVQIGAIKRDQLYPYNTNSDQILAKGCDLSSEPIELKVPVTFYGETYTNLYVSNKGLISFRTDIPTFLNIEFPLPYPSISAFYTNIDTTEGGNVYFRETDDNISMLKAAESVQSNYPDYSDYRPTSIFVATWDNVGYYRAHNDKLNTFQIAIISNGTESFVELLYPEDGIQWLQGDEEQGRAVATAQAGLASEDGRYFNLKGSGTHLIRNLVAWSNAHEAGKFIYRVGQVSEHIASPDDGLFDETEDYDTMTCQQASKTCHFDARCIDYDSGFCCECNEGFYGNGKNCLKNNLPLRVNGRLSGEINRVQLNDVAIQAYVVTGEGRVYTALSPVPDSIGYSLQTLNVLGGVIGWLFASPMDLAKNGYQLTSAVFNHSAEIHYPITGDTVRITQEYLGHDVFDDITLEAQIKGTVPPVTGQLDLTEYEEHYTVVSPGVISSSSKRVFKNSNDNSIYEERIKQTIQFNPCSHEPVKPENTISTTMKVGKNTISFEDEIVRFGMSNKLFPLNMEDPCIRGRATCGPNSSCVVYENTFKCVCDKGYQSYDTRETSYCVDIDECYYNEHQCDPSAKCTNEEGSYKCECPPGFEGNGFTCRTIVPASTRASCDAVRCEQNAHCEELTPGYPECLCDEGFAKKYGICTETCSAEKECQAYSYCDIRDTEPSFCECEAGYRRDSYGYCVQEQEMTTTEKIQGYPLPICSFDGTCTCPEGFERITDEMTYQEKCIPASAASPTDDYGAHCNSNNQCPNNALCEYTTKTNRYECHCIIGYVSVDNECVKDPYCTSDKDCDVNARCKYNSDFEVYECQCHEGFRKDQGGSCVSDLCNNAVCVEHSSCVWDNNAGVDYCQCDDGFIGDGIYSCVLNGTSCEEANKCVEHAVCQQNNYTGVQYCVCIDGYSGDGYSLCTPDPTCQHDPNMCSPNAACIETTDGYSCQCNRGFIGNGVDCQSRPKPPGNFLLLAEDIFIKRVPFIQTPRDIVRPILNDFEQMTIGVDIDCPNGRVYWSDAEKGAIKSANYDGTDIQIFLDTDIKSPEALAIDWEGRNIYWTDSAKLTVEVANIDTRVRKVLIKAGLKNPRGIAVHPLRGKIFWSDWNRKSPSIRWANMDGSQVDNFAPSDAIMLPNALAIDALSDSLCYTDAGLKKINCIQIDTRQLSTEAENCNYPFGLTITNDKFYWTDWKTHQIESQDRRTKLRKGIPTGAANNKLFNIVAVPEQCSTNSYSICHDNNGNCPPNSLCLPDGVGGRNCI